MVRITVKDGQCVDVVDRAYNIHNILDPKVPLQDKLGTFESLKGHAASRMMQELAKKSSGPRTEKLAQMLFLNSNADLSEFCVATVDHDVPEAIGREMKLAIN